MKRILTPCTIVPSELYVSRDADTQLRNVLQDMGRPGYVLVARQMGKTNLLLNAKRELDDAENAVIYVDLSAPFSNERECFRHIVDTALDARPDTFDSCGPVILESRKGNALAPYREHEKELRALLDAIPGKLVIILDEIDSLTKGTFSDRVFAQIRSVYFNRTTYRQFERLTYVLSGVVEPNEIIKDKKISPFNIGEKIYLDDFTYVQYQEFLRRAGLDLAADAVDRIHYWANGNPRLTWDICYDLEGKLAADMPIAPSDVDASVKALYLTDFSRAPVDHIREVVTADDDLRNAITVIHYGKGDTLSDTTKSKLYLAGIIRSAANHGNIAIKNRIIDAALSDNWLADIALQKKGLAKIAAEKYESKQYEAALSLFEEFVQSPDVSQKEKESSYWTMSMCAYNTGNYPKALEYLGKVHWDKGGTALLYYEHALYCGICHMKLSNLEASRRHFNEILQSPTKDKTFFSALLNHAASYSAEGNFARAAMMLQEAITSIENCSLPSEDCDTLKASAFYNLAQASVDLRHDDDARAYCQRALDASTVRQRPEIWIALYNLLTAPEERESVLKQSIELIISEGLRPGPSKSEGALALTTSTLYAHLLAAYAHSLPLFQRLLAYVETLEEMCTSRASILLSIAYLSLQAEDNAAAITLAREVVAAATSGSVVDRESEFQGYRLLSLFCKGKEQKDAQIKYAKCLRTGYDPQTIGAADFQILGDLAADFIKNHKPDKALEFIDLAKSLEPLLPKNLMADLAPIRYFEMMALRDRNDWGRLKEASKETLTLVEVVLSYPNESSWVTEDVIRQIQKIAKSNLDPAKDVFAAHFERERPKKMGRNAIVSVRYTDGTVRRDVKFKRIEADLVAGRCFLLDHEEPKRRSDGVVSGYRDKSKR